MKKHLSLFLLIFSVSANESIENQLRTDLLKKYPEAKISFLAPIEIQSRIDLSSSSVLSSQLMPLGQLRAQLVDARGAQSTLQTKVDVQIPAYLSKKRLHPGDVLKAEDFITAFVSLSDASTKENSSVILSPKQQSLEGLEAKNSILEGQYVLTTGVRKLISIKRGDSVQIKLNSGEIVLTTTGQALEPASVGQTIKVLTNKTKKELSGIVKDQNQVEVKL